MGHGCVDACNLNVSARLNVPEIPKLRSVYLWYRTALRSFFEQFGANNGLANLIRGNNIPEGGNNSVPLLAGPSKSFNASHAPK